MKQTIDQVERERNASCGHYHEDTNSYDELFEYNEPVRCDYCGHYFDEDEIEPIAGENICVDCYQNYMDDLEIMFDKDERLELDKVFEINKTNKAS